MEGLMEEDEAKAEDDISDSFTDRRLIDDEWIAISKDDHGKGKEEVMIKGGMDPGSSLLPSLYHDHLYLLQSIHHRSDVCQQSYH